MAGNDWINSYLEAILDVGPGLDDAKSSLLLRERGRFSPTRYFVAEVISGFDETDLYRSWVRVMLYYTLCLTFVPLFSSTIQLLLEEIDRLVFFCGRPLQRGVLRRGIRDWRICVGGFGTWLGKRSR